MQDVGQRADVVCRKSVPHACSGVSFFCFLRVLPLLLRVLCGYLWFFAEYAKKRGVLELFPARLPVMKSQSEFELHHQLKLTRVIGIARVSAKRRGCAIVVLQLADLRAARGSQIGCYNRRSKCSIQAGLELSVVEQVGCLSGDAEGISFPNPEVLLQRHVHIPRGVTAHVAVGG